MKLKVTVDGREYDVEVEVEQEAKPALGSLLVRSTSAYGVTPTVAKAPAASSNALTSPMQGTIVKVGVEEGATVAEGDLVVVLEAMKMEQPITAHRAGKVTSLSAEVGATVSSGAVLCEIVDES